MRYRRKKSPIKRILLLVLVLIFAFNAGDIGRFFFPIPYQTIIFREAHSEGMDPYLIAAVVKTESNSNPAAVSNKGALGLMQVMPETCRWIAEKTGINWYSTQLLMDPEYNIKIGVWYMAELHKEYNGDTVPALAAYNAGMGNVNKWLEQHQWDGKRDSIDEIPFAETRHYIRKVLFYQQIYKHLYQPTP